MLSANLTAAFHAVYVPHNAYLPGALSPWSWHKFMLLHVRALDVNNGVDQRPSNFPYNTLDERNIWGHVLSTSWEGAWRTVVLCSKLRLWNFWSKPNGSVQASTSNTTWLKNPARPQATFWGVRFFGIYVAKACGIWRFIPSLQTFKSGHFVIFSCKSQTSAMGDKYQVCFHT